MKNAFTVDLEDWFCSHNLIGEIKYEDWDKQEGRVTAPTLRLLDLLKKYNRKATFFVLGWVADRYPELIQKVAADGHEIASHGYSHKLLTGITSDFFEEDLLKSVNAIERACGVKPTGYRAPAFTVVNSTKWAFDILKKLGFTYDSSVYPTSVHPDYGIGDAPLSIYSPQNGLTEIPLSCAVLFNRNIPCSGGAYLRFLPYFFYKQLVNSVIKSGRSYIFYTHPWEIDTEIPRIKLPVFKAMRHYTNLASTFGKIERLLQDFEFTSLQDILSEQQTG
ncbi:XrtA system polysaccharide deacetylase [Mucilaginibacter psychrotolerans]|uniref:DUF3473 domain-containing protein n=1 Tax=Mucilaginibacter psychrotolerans TaxID=1524096 RepID=A0A4Y8S4T8_9SPHI|nr:XrtA system polysaccharide deacetylase [Mucilaginibacter psychrotolerans]TFF33973.1 DUF3473 domain-containing protein [Mucilaginibacter psychrotolerans]